jgi:hypothetical protein
MGLPVLVLGPSGSGKTASLRNFAPEEIGIFNVASKPLPFRKKLPKIDGASYQQIAEGIKQSKCKVFAIDDSQYLQVFENFRRAKEVGYTKFVDMALAENSLIQFVIRQTPPDTIVYFLRHVEEFDDGRVRAKTIGKMLDNQLGGLEGLFAIVLFARTDGKDHWFETQSDGYTSAKTPMEMFDSLKIPNDLKEVDKTIREYYELGERDEREKEVQGKSGK